MRGTFKRTLPGEISAQQFKRYLSTTSDNRTPLTVDDGRTDGPDGADIAGRGYIDAAVRPRRGSGFPNPEPDYGNLDVNRGHMDAAPNIFLAPSGRPAAPGPDRGQGSPPRP
jgi:hypothetical protein